MAKAKNTNTKLSDSIEDAALKAKVAELEAENEALKLTAAEAEEAKPAARLSEKDRTFTVEVNVDPEGKKKKKVKAMLLDVPGIYLSGKKYTQEAFMADEALQVQAASCEHMNIKILK